MALIKLRKKIDRIDSKILKLLAKRLKVCRELGKYKHENNLPIQNKEREKQVTRQRIEKFKELGVDDEEFVTELFEVIMKKAREVQK